MPLGFPPGVFGELLEWILHGHEAWEEGLAQMRADDDGMRQHESA